MKLIQQNSVLIDWFIPELKFIFPGSYVFVFIISAFFIFSNPAIAAKDIKTQATANSITQEQTALFQQAVTFDLAGNPEAARKFYDQLNGTDFKAQIAIPSAVNRVALQQFSLAGKEFKLIAQGTDVKASEYAQLWQLWLLAHNGSGSSAKLQKKLAAAAMTISPTNPRYQTLVALYAGKGSVESVFSAVDKMPDADLYAKRDALTEATFFTGSYLQYVKHDRSAAQQVYERDQKQLNSTSLERPLIQKTAASLSAAH